MRKLFEVEMIVNTQFIIEWVVPLKSIYKVTISTFQRWVYILLVFFLTIITYLCWLWHNSSIKYVTISLHFKQNNLCAFLVYISFISSNTLFFQIRKIVCTVHRFSILNHMHTTLAEHINFIVRYNTSYEMCNTFSRSYAVCLYIVHNRLRGFTVSVFL